MVRREEGSRFVLKMLFHQLLGHKMSSGKKIGLFACTGIVAGNMMGSGIALLPSNLASIGSVALFGWLIAMFGALALAYVYARLSTVNPQSGGPVAYAGEISPAFGYQTGVLYYHANWIGNLAIAITAVSYLSVFFPILNHPIPAGIACVAVVWFFTILNFFGGSMIGKVTTFGVIALLIPVVGTATFGWFWFDPQTYTANWNTSGAADSEAVIRSVLLCLWAFIGIESASVSTGLVKNPRKTVPLATLLGTGLAGIVYVLSFQAIAGMFPADVIAKSGAPFAASVALMVGDWAAPVVAACTVIACLTSLGSWMLLVTQAGARAARDGHFPKIYGELDHRGMPRKGLILAASQMTGLMLLITALNAKGGSAASLFEMITEIAVLLTMLPYFYSCIDLLRIESTSRQGRLSCIAAVLGCGFCFIALAGAGATNLMLTIGVSLVVMMIYSWRMGTVQANRLRFAAQPISSSAAGS